MAEISSKAKSRSSSGILIILMAVLLLGTVFCVPLAIHGTWAWGTGTDHTLTYTRNSLTWDSNTAVLSDGTAVLTLFNDNYTNVNAANGDKVFAPGTSGTNNIRLINNVTGGITYTATLYKVSTDSSLPVDVSMSASGAYRTNKYYVPSGVSASDVIVAYTGTLAGKSLQTFVIDWDWLFEQNGEAGDILDTALGNAAVPAEAEVGIYIVVNDNNTYTVPKTGDADGQMLLLRFVCMTVSAAALVLIIASLRKRRS